MPPYFITFEGTEGGGKTTQIARLKERLEALGKRVVVLREPGGTVVGEEIRHTLKHSAEGRQLCAQAELLLMNASRAQLVREVIRPALARGDVVLCDRFYDSTIAYQGHGRQLDLDQVRRVIDLAVGETRPHLTLLLEVSLEVSEQRRAARAALTPASDRIEESGRTFFQRVEQGYQRIAEAEPQRVRVIDASRTVDQVEQEVWEVVSNAFGWNA